MTDGIISTCVQTQTPTPRISSMFFDEYFERPPDDLSNDDLQIALTTNERKLIEQIKEIRDIDKQLVALKNTKQEDDDDDNDNSDDSLVDSETNYSLKTYLQKRHYEKSKGFLKPILQSWTYDILDNGDCLPQRAATDNTSNHFNNIAMGRKLANMTLSATNYKKSNLKIPKSLVWTEAQQSAINILINEANALLDVFEEMSMVLGPDLLLNDVPERDHTEIKFLSKYWSPILDSSRLLIEKKISLLKNPEIRKVQKINPGDFA